jgi:hypothetical protein
MRLALKILYMSSELESVKPYIFRNPIQNRIYQRLDRLVGTGPAVFFKDACSLMDQEAPLPSTTHLVSHLLRDIESALRDVLEPFSDREKKKNHRQEILSTLNALEIPENDPIAEMWLGVIGKDNINALPARAHRNNLASPRPIDSEFYRFWFNMEKILDVVLDRFESRYVIIQDKLNGIKQKKQPDIDDAIYIKKHVPNNIVAFKYFFQDLENAAWIKPLWDEGFFNNPPEPVEHSEEGTISYPEWPQSRYLLKMASLEQKLVSNIILGIETTNGNVQADLIDAVCILPSTLAAQHAEKISQWLKSPSIFMEHRIGNLVTCLASGKEITSAAVLTKEFLRLRTGNLKGTKETDETPLMHLEPLSRVDSWEYGEFLKNNYPDFLNAAPREALSLVIDILEEALHLQGYGQIDDLRIYS